MNFQCPDCGGGFQKLTIINGHKKCCPWCGRVVKTGQMTNSEWKRMVEEHGD